MDALKKFLNLNRDENVNQPSKRSTFGNEFRKPVWFDDCESDDELSERKGFQVFTNPMEMQMYFERQMVEQMQEILKSVETFEGGRVFVDEDIREKFLKPGFEDLDFFQQKKAIDTDLDDEIYADQLHSLLQRISPELSTSNMKTFVNENKSAKLTDEETIWDRIHGTFVDAKKPNPPKRNQQLLKKIPQPRGGIFEGALQGPKVFRQSVMTQIIRKPDGSTETRRTIRDSDGNENTTVVSRTGDGKVETFNYSGDGQVVQKQVKENNNYILSLLSLNRNMFVTKEGYAIPKLW